MTAAVVTVALPATALAIVVLLRSPLARRLVSAPRDDRWHERHTPSLGGIAIFAGVLRDRRGQDTPEPDGARPLARRRARVRRIPAVQPAARPTRGGLHGRLGQPGARLRARLARTRRELEGGRDDRRDAAPADTRA